MNQGRVHNRARRDPHALGLQRFTAPRISSPRWFSSGRCRNLHTVVSSGTGSAPKLYGTTLTGGDPECDCGIVFELDPTGKETVLHLLPDKQMEDSLKQI